MKLVGTENTQQVRRLGGLSWFSGNAGAPNQRPLPTVTLQPLFGARKKSHHTAEEKVKLSLAVTKSFAKNLQAAAVRLGMTPGELLEYLLPQYAKTPPVKDIIPSVRASVQGRHNGGPVETQITTLIGAEQIFDGWLDVLDKTEHYAQVALYDFDNIKVGGRAVEGADAIAAWEKQQQVLTKIEEKAREGKRFQILLDSSVQYQYDSFGNPIFPRKRNNQEMLDYLRRLKEEGLPIQVVSYPRHLANIYHIKGLWSDGVRFIGGGMNLSNHSAANWDACVLVEGPEVANIVQDTFEQDWIMSRLAQNHSLTVDTIRTELPKVEAVSHPAIKVLNTIPREYAAAGFRPREEIREYFDRKLQDPDLKGVYSEQFITTHIPTAEKLMELHKKGVPIRILHSAGVLEKFPYTRNAVFALNKQGEVVRFYKEWKPTGEQNHSKWTVFEHNNKPDEVIIGSANTSAAAFETNIGKGDRDDYPVGKERPYRRGNRDFAMVIPSRAIANAFKAQFEKDWKYSEQAKPEAYGLHGKSGIKPVSPDEVRRLLDEIG